MRFVNIFCLIKGCEAAIQWLALLINTVAENLASPWVFAGGALISAFSLFVARYDLI
jgi:hypothetical protein